MKFVFCLLLMCLAVPAFAAPKTSPPFALSASIEEVWSKLQWPERDGTKQFDSDTKVSLVPSFELRENIYLTGRFSYPIQSQLPEYAVGIEFKVY